MAEKSRRKTRGKIQKIKKKNQLKNYKKTIVMARLSRLVLIGYPQHIITLGNNRHQVFSATKDYRFL